MIGHQPVGDHAALVRAADHHRDDMAGVRQMRDAGGVEPCAHGRDIGALRLSFRVRHLQVPDRGTGPGGDGGRQGRGEDETAGKGPHEIHQCCGCRDVAADDAVGLTQRALNNREAVHQPLRLGHAAAARTVEADGMDLVEVGHGAVTVGQIADVTDRGDVAVHGIDALECDQLGGIGRQGGQLRLKVRKVVVPPDNGLRAAVAHAFDHAGVVQRVRQHDAAGDACGQRAQRRPVRDVAGGEQQRRLLPVQVGEFGLQRDMGMAGAADVAGAPCPRAVGVEGVVHRRQHRRMLAHAEVVVRAPHRHVARGAVAVVRGAWKGAPVAAEVGEDAVVAVGLQAVERGAEQVVVAHQRPAASRAISSSRACTSCMGPAGWLR